MYLLDEEEASEAKSRVERRLNNRGRRCDVRKGAVVICRALDGHM